MFKFLKEDDSQEEKKKDSGQVKEVSKVEVVQLEPAKEIIINELHYQIRKHVPCHQYILLPTNQASSTTSSTNNEEEKQVSIQFILVSQLLRSEFVKDNEKVKSILDSTSDLISGVYEGNL